jgi:hypothetical protein
VTFVFSLLSATEITEKKIFSPRGGPANLRYKEHQMPKLARGKS